MPSTTSKKTEPTEPSELDLLKQKHAELDNKLDLILEPLTVDDMIKDNIVKEPDTYFIINNISYKLK